LSTEVAIVRRGAFSGILLSFYQSFFTICLYGIKPASEDLHTVITDFNNHGFGRMKGLPDTLFTARVNVPDSE
jgi:hypothetical protein